MKKFRRMPRNAIASLDSGALRLSSLLLALAVFSGIVVHGASRAGSFDDEHGPLAGLPGRLSSLVGLAADDISISGLMQHDAREVLTILHVKPGTSLLGFDADAARTALEKLPWVKSAAVSREYPNMLRASVVERHAVALWQNAGNVDLTDETGANMGRPTMPNLGQFLLVTGVGANIAAADLINQMSAIPELQKRVTAAARVGARRWNLYLDTGVKLALPEDGVAEALKTAWSLEQSQALFSTGVALIDLRLQGQVGFQVAKLDGEQKPAVHP